MSKPPDDLEQLEAAAVLEALSGWELSYFVCPFCLSSTLRRDLKTNVLHCALCNYRWDGFAHGEGF